MERGLSYSASSAESWMLASFSDIKNNNIIVVFTSPSLPTFHFYLCYSLVPPARGHVTKVKPAPVENAFKRTLSANCLTVSAMIQTKGDWDSQQRKTPPPWLLADCLTKLAYNLNQYLPEGFHPNKNGIFPLPSNGTISSNLSVRIETGICNESFEAWITASFSLQIFGLHGMFFICLVTQCITSVVTNEDGVFLGDLVVQSQ